MPPLIMHGPWSEIVSPELPLPGFDLKLPIIIPLENIPVSLLPLFGIVPKPLLLLEYKPLIPEPPQEEVEPPTEQAEEPPAEVEKVEAPAEAERDQNKKRRKKKGAGTAEATQAAKPAEQPPKPAAEPGKALHELSPEEAEAAILGTSVGETKKKPAAAQPPPKRTKAQKQHEKQQRALKDKAQKDDEERVRKEKEQKEAERRENDTKEAEARVALRAVLDSHLVTLTQERNSVPAGAAYDAIRQEARAGVTTLTAYLADGGPAETAPSAQLKARAEEMFKLIIKVRNFTPPETPAQRRLRLFEGIKTNVRIAFGREQWEGRKGGQTDFTVDKTDTNMRQLILNYYGKDQREIDGHTTRDYPGKTKTSKVFYYVTGTSNTQGIAYDITLHAWEGNDQIGTVCVLHIPDEKR
jgi:hypothetical protein